MQHQFVDKQVLSKMIQSSTLLWLMDLNKTPYHLGISSNGKFYSLRAHAKDEGKPAERLLNSLEKKNVSLGFIPLMNQLSVEHLSAVFSRYTTCLEGGTSCLHPILEALDVDPQNWVLYDLVDYLEEIGQCPELYIYPVNTSFDGLKPYTYQEVEENLKTFVQS